MRFSYEITVRGGMSTAKIGVVSVEPTTWRCDLSQRDPFDGESMDGGAEHERVIKAVDTAFGGAKWLDPEEMDDATNALIRLADEAIKHEAEEGAR